MQAKHTLDTEISAFLRDVPFCVDVEFPIEKARWWMEEWHLEYLPVTEDGRFFGVLRAKNLLKVEPGAEKTSQEPNIREITITNLTTCNADSTIGDVLDRMMRTGCREIVLIDDDRVAGLFTTNDLLRLIDESDVRSGDCFGLRMLSR